MSGAYTPGPWLLSKNAAYPSARPMSTWTISTDRGFILASVYCSEEAPEANAPLLAAAPDLLEALRGLLAELNCPSRKAIEKAHAAIVLATSRSS